MPSENESAEKMRRRPHRLSMSTGTQQREQRNHRQQNVREPMRATTHVTARRQYVHRQSHHQQTGRNDMCGLKVPMAPPEPLPNGSRRRHCQKKQGKESQKSSVFVTRGGQLEMLNDTVIDCEQQADVEHRDSERRPANKLMTA